MRNLLLAISVFCCSLLCSQKLYFQHFGSRDGLPSDEVYNLHQDSRGYLWIFTNHGAVKFNGFEFIPVITNLPPNDRFVYSFYENKRGEKWFANSRGKLYRIRNDSAFVVKGTEKLSRKLESEVSEVYDLAVDDSLNVFVVTKRVSYKCIPVADSCMIRRLDEGMDTSLEFRLIRAGDKTIAVMNFLNVRYENIDYLFNLPEIDVAAEEFGKTPVYFKIKGRTRSGPRRCLRMHGYTYVAFYNRLLLLYPGKPPKNIDVPSFINSFSVRPDGDIWVATLHHGLLQYSSSGELKNNYLSSMTVNDLCFDSQNGLWASTSTGGLFYASDINSYYFDDTSPLGKTISFVRTIDSLVFIGVSGGQVYSFNGKNFRMISGEDSLGQPLDIIKAGEDLILSKTFGVEFRNFASPAKLIRQNNRIIYGFRLHFLNDTLIYSHRKGIGLLNPGAKILRADLMRKIYDFVIKGNDLWLGTETGVMKYNGFREERTPVVNQYYPIILDSARVIPEFEPLKDISVSRIVQQDKNSTWFCTRGAGLYQYDGKRLRHFDGITGLPSEFINNLLFVNDWMMVCANNGFFRCRISGDSVIAMQRLFAGDVKEAAFSGDRFFLATGSGLVLRQDHSDERTRFSFHFRQLLVNGEAKNISEDLRLSHDQNQLEFVYDLISLNGDYSRIRYKLTGPNNENGFEEGNAIRLRNLAPGAYTLVSAPVIMGPALAGSEIRFTIEKAFWQTTFFRAFATIVLLTVSFLTFTQIMGVYRRRQEKKSEAEKIVLEYKLIALKAQVNPHFVSNCLSAIQHLIVNKQQNAATSYIARFGYLVRQILNFSSQSIVTLADELEIVELYTELEQLRFQSKFTIEIEISGIPDPSAVYVPSLILNPIVENAIWHGLLPLKDERRGRILLSVSKEGQLLRIVLEDNGVGRGQKTDSLGNTRESKGMLLTEQRLANINYLYKTREASVSYEDLTCEGRPCGTRVILKLPASLKP